MMNQKFVKKYKMISKVCKNVSKDKRVINIHDDPFQKICYLSVIETESDYNLKSRSFKFLKLLTFIFFSVNQIH